MKSEEEAKSLAAPFIGKLPSKPPKYKCLVDSCPYENARLLMTQSHVYKHLDIFTFQCQYCGLKCRLETNFEKHLNTHGVTRRKEKTGKYVYFSEELHTSNLNNSLENSVNGVGNIKYVIDSSENSSSHTSSEEHSNEHDQLGEVFQSSGVKMMKKYIFK